MRAKAKRKIMSRTKKKDWARTTVSPNKDISDRWAQLAKFEGMTKTQFLEFLIQNWDAGINPEEELNQLIAKRKEAIELSNGLEVRIRKATDKIAIHGQWKKEKFAKRAEGIKILERVMRENGMEAAERTSRVWQRITGIQGMELLVEAKENIERRGT